jgi:hypothetical protein
MSALPPDSDRNADIAECPLSADTVAKGFLALAPAMLIQNHASIRTIDSKANPS